MGHPHRLRRGAGGGPQGKLIEGTRALYWKAPSADEIAPLGLTLEDYPPPSAEIWPENWPAIQLFTRIASQWRVGAGGPTGLDYLVLFHELDRMNLEPDAYDGLFAQIRVIESTALEEMHKKA